MISRACQGCHNESLVLIVELGLSQGTTSDVDDAEYTGTSLEKTGGQGCDRCTNDTASSTQT